MPRRKRTRKNAEYDRPWKRVLQNHLQAFLLYFFQDIVADIDWNRGYRSLARRAKIGKLFKVWLKDGAERWLLIHFEVQNEYDKDFEARMFHYNVAAYQMYNNPRHDWPHWATNAPIGGRPSFVRVCGAVKRS